MKQIVQDLSSGETSLVETPVARLLDGQVLIRSRSSLISSGTERALVEFGRAGWVGKARRQPEKIQQILHKVRTDGVAATVEAVRSKLDQPLPLGYCSVGVVERCGPGVTGFDVGDRIASNGAHAELVAVPETLCAKIPETVSDETAAFTVLGAIGLQGVRLAQPTLGECFVVVGLGVIGLMTVQILRANGCRVLGMDPDSTKTAVAEKLGADICVLGGDEDALAVANEFSRGRGVDGVLLTLSSTSNEPLRQAARMCRKRGRIVLIGVTGLELNRDDFYEKELTFQVSCSYGPGRYDAAYEEHGRDYPVAFVRWTAQRNFEAVLDMMASGALLTESLITHRFAFSEAPTAYELLNEGSEPHLGILLTYDGAADETATTVVLEHPAEPATSELSLAVIGAGNYSSRMLIPAFKREGVSLHSLANTGGVNAAHHARKFGFRQVTTDTESLIASRDVNVLAIATRHDSHAQLVCSALAAGKHVFVEKPLALTHEQLDEIRRSYERATGDATTGPLLMVGFNRRFSPLVVKLKALLSSVAMPKSIVITVNAGALPADHWTQDPLVGGGRILGEACHFVDLARHIVDVPVKEYMVHSLGRSAGAAVNDDKSTLTLTFEDGSVATIHYLANGHRTFPKERIEVFCDGRVLQIENFRRLRAYGWRRFRGMSLWRQDKGHRACIAAFVQAVRGGGPAPISFDELCEVSRVTIELARAARA